MKYLGDASSCLPFISSKILAPADLARSLNSSKEFSKFDCPEILVQKPKIDSHGTWSSNIALSLSRICHVPPSGAV